MIRERLTLFDLAQDVTVELTGLTARPAAPIGPDARSAAYKRCACGAWATYGFGVSFNHDKPGLRMCAACARAAGRQRTAT